MNTSSSSALPIPRQLAPTVGPKASGVLFQAGALGEIGKTMAVGRARIINNFGCIEDDGSYVPANDALVSSFVVPFGTINIFMGFTAEAYGFPRGSAAFWPTHHPIDYAIEQQHRSDQTFVYRDLSDSDTQSDSDSSSYELMEPASRFVGVIDASGPKPAESDPESILPALQTGADSEAGSDGTAPMAEDSDLDEHKEEDFAAQVAARGYGSSDPNEVLMTFPAQIAMEDGAAAAKPDEAEVSSSIKHIGDKAEKPEEVLDPKGPSPATPIEEDLERSKEAHMRALELLKTPLGPNSTAAELEERRKALLLRLRSTSSISCPS